MNLSASILDGLARGSSRAYAALFDACYAHLHELAYTYVLDYDLADDIVQEVLITLYERTDVRNVTNLASYLRTSVRNRSLNYLRDLSLEVQNRELYIKEFCHREDLDESEMASVYSVLKGEVENLPKACREVCQLRFYEGMKVREIAERLGISEGTVKAQLHRALHTIKEALKEGDLPRFTVTKCIVFVILFHIL